MSQALERLKRALSRRPRPSDDAAPPTPLSARPDIYEVIQEAMEFQTAVDAVKARLQPADFGWYPYDSWTNIFPLDELLTGERRFLLDLIGEDPVLDVGCADGVLSFFLESLGCKVDAIDYPSTNYNAMRGVKALKAALTSAVGIYEVDVDAQFSLPHNQYGLVFLLGVLYHLKNPFYVLEALSRHARYCLLSTRVARFTPDKRTKLHTAPVAYLLADREANNDPTNYWIFSEAGLRRLLERTGWEVLDYRTAGNTTDSDPVSGEGDERVFCLAKSLCPKVAAKLLQGWHALEQNSWRWTEREFSAAIELPAAGRPATLRLEFLLPPPLLARLHSITLSAKVNGVALLSETYNTPGAQVYVRRIPPPALTPSEAHVDFQLDKALPVEESDRRERGVVVSYLGVE